MRTEFAPKIAGTSKTQGILWSARVNDWAEIQEGMCYPLFLSALVHAGIEPGIRHLDIGCGAGRVSSMSARMGATVYGLDASGASIAIARQRTPDGHFEIGEMEELPYADSMFDLVTGFNSFQFAGNSENALREARRVLRAEGKIIVAAWGNPERCQAIAFLSAIKPLMPPPPPGAQGPFAFSNDGALETFLSSARLQLIRTEEVNCQWVYTDQRMALRGLLSAGPAVRAIQHSGEELVAEAVIDAIAPFRHPDGSYWMDNRFRYVIAQKS